MSSGDRARDTHDFTHTFKSPLRSLYATNIERIPLPQRVAPMAINGDECLNARTAHPANVRRALDDDDQDE
jgi:hypothetical protein